MIYFMDEILKDEIFYGWDIERWDILLMRHWKMGYFIDEIFYRWDILLMRYFIDETFYRWDILKMKYFIDEIFYRWDIERWDIL